MNARIIPCLLLSGQGLVKTTKFKKGVYVGDPINAVRIFNEKEVDELVFLDISATKEHRDPDYSYITKLAGECFMPFAYGGGISTLDQIRKLNACGVEKVVINSAAFADPDFVSNAVKSFGSSSIVLSIDVKKDFWGAYKIFTHSGTRPIKENFKDVLSLINKWEVGEVIINSIDCDGIMRGYDLPLIKQATSVLDMPVVALGGAGNVEDIKKVIKECDASAAAAGSLFVFYGPHKAVLINYLTQDQIDEINT